LLHALYRVFFERKFSFTPENANRVNSIVYIISAVASPALGLLVDKVGMNVFWVFLSVFVSIGTHALLGFTFINPYISMVRIKSVIIVVVSTDLGKVVEFWTFHESGSEVQNFQF
jgi:nitrate/nitrite transporter NarK